MRNSLNLNLLERLETIVSYMTYMSQAYGIGLYATVEVQCINVLDN